jgi:60 kDa SS-A/Ro ribonucleoprotein
MVGKGSDPLASINLVNTPQTQPSRPDQVKNNAGGYVFAADTEAQLKRFIMIGSSSTYYAKEREVTLANSALVVNEARRDATSLVRLVEEISVAGRAHRQNPGVFALACASAFGDEAGRRCAYAAVPRVCRTGTTFFQWVTYRDAIKGTWSRGSRNAAARWYTARDAADTAYQILKYRNRVGYSHRDVLRLAHPKTVDAELKALFAWVTHESQSDQLPSQVLGFIEAQRATELATWVRLIGQHRLSWEMLPDAALNSPEVWEALLETGMPQGALLRQLPRLTRVGLISHRSMWAAKIAEQLVDMDRLKRARIHPIQLLIAGRTYAQGHSNRGKSTWTPVTQIVDILDAAFYASFGVIEPANKRTLLALDVSGSMGASAGDLPISCHELSAAMALVIMATEPDCMVVGYAGGKSRYMGWGSQGRVLPGQLIDGLCTLNISPRQRLNDVIRTISDLPFGGTDASLPLLWATAAKMDFDTVVSVTDNETWAGNVHPHQALEHYRQARGIPTRLAVAAMTPTEFTIADPNDPGSMDICGFDSAVPNLLNEFSRGEV